jgi:transcriptional regulator with XRE-family HTH domain
LPKSIHTPAHRRLCALLKKHRKDAGLTQTVVAKKLDRPPSYVAIYEGGDRRLDVLDFLEVADAIGFDPCRFLRTLKGCLGGPLAGEPDTNEQRETTAAEIFQQPCSIHHGVRQHSIPQAAYATSLSEGVSSSETMADPLYVTFLPRYRA